MQQCKPHSRPYSNIHRVDIWDIKLRITLKNKQKMCPGPAQTDGNEQCLFLNRLEWVNPSKRGGMDGVFRGLAGLLRGISRGRSPREIPRSSPASPRKARAFPTLLFRFTSYFQHGFSKFWGQQGSKLFFFTLFQLTSDDKLQILTQLSFHNFVVQNIFVINYFVVRPLWKVVEKF